MPDSTDPLRSLSRLLQRASRRHRLQRAWRTAGLVGWPGLLFGLGLAGWLRLGGAPAAWATGAGLTLWLLLVGLASVVALALRPLGPRELALLLDRRLGTGELLVTSLHLGQVAGPRSRDVQEALSAWLSETRRPLRAAMPLPWPRHVRALPLGALLFLAVPSVGPIPTSTSGGGLAQEAERLRPRTPTPASRPGDDLTDEVARLAEEMRRGTVSEEEAKARMADLQERLRELDRRLAPSTDLLRELTAAAEALDEAKDGDAGPAGGEGEPLTEVGTPSTDRQRAADAVSRAAEALASSEDPEARALGEQLREVGAGDQARLEEALSSARALEERLRRDQEALRRNRELQTSLEGSRQRLGGEPSVDGGQSEAECAGDAEGGEPSVGLAHTWEEDGGEASQAPDRSDRHSARREGLQIDDFERLYAAVRLEDAEALLASEPGVLDERGRIDEVRTRRSADPEAASQPLLALPPSYAEAAAEAVRSEAVPPGYRDAVRHYFVADE